MRRAWALVPARSSGGEHIGPKKGRGSGSSRVTARVHAAVRRWTPELYMWQGFLAGSRQCRRGGTCSRSARRATLERALGDRYTTILSDEAVISSIRRLWHHLIVSVQSPDAQTPASRSQRRVPNLRCVLAVDARIAALESARSNGFLVTGSDKAVTSSKRRLF